MLKLSISFISRCTYKIIEAQKFEAQYCKKKTVPHENKIPRKPKFLRFLNDQPKIKKTKQEITATATEIQNPKETNKGIPFLGKSFEINKSRYVEIPIETQIQLFYKALKHSGGSSISDIYKISHKEFIKSPEGHYIFFFYGGSMVRMCYTLFPDFEWVPWLFKKNADLSKLRKQKDYDYNREIKWFAAKHNINDSNLDDWYKMKLTDLLSECKIRNIFTVALVNFIQKVYPHHKFYLFKFHKIKIWWKDPKALDDFRQCLLKETQFTSMEQFYLLPRLKLTSMGGASLLHHHKYDLYTVLCLLFPHYPWNKELLTVDVLRQLTNPNFEKKEVTVSKNFNFPTFVKKAKSKTLILTQKEIQQELLNKINENFE
ncbi:hypothetical protein ACTFIZ_003934 [Dictyostelium cf. discoideum]